LATLSFPVQVLAQQPSSSAAPEGPADAAAPASKHERAEAADAPNHSRRQGSQTIKVGLDLSSITKFDLATGGFVADFYLDLQCPSADDCMPGFDLENGKVTSKELIVDEPQRKVFKVKAELGGEVDLSDFPFDHHLLPIVVVEDPEAETNVTFEIDEEQSSIEDVKLSGWQIAKAVASATTEKVDGIPDGVSQASFGVEIRRPLLSAFFKTFLPILFIVLASWVALFISTKAAPPRIATITGGLLACVMFHVSSTSSLPPMGELTRVDKFLLATYAGQIVNIATAVLIAKFEDAKDEVKAKKVYNLAFLLVPGFTIVAWVASMFA
jgi:hypothetical protein